MSVSRRDATASHADRFPRDKRGEWKPPGILASCPVFAWPPKLVTALKWFFFYPGYLLPWNLGYIAISVATWLWLTPDMATMKSFEPGWIAFILARNLAMIVLITGLWHLRLYMHKAQGTDYKYSNRWMAKGNSNFLFKSQVLDNVFWTVASAVPIWTAYEVVLLWAYANGHIVYLSWNDHPVYLTLLLILVQMIHELHFYLVHRMIHWKPLYDRVHHLHHKNIIPGPWSGLAMHPVEHLLYFSGVLIFWIIPSHPLHALFLLQQSAFTPAQGHAGFQRVVLKDGVTVETGDYFHYLHHRFFECNYGGETVPVDKWFGTFHDGSPEAEAAMHKRFLASQGAKPGA